MLFFTNPNTHTQLSTHKDTRYSFMLEQGCSKLHIVAKVSWQTDSSTQQLGGVGEHALPGKFMLGNYF